MPIPKVSIRPGVSVLSVLRYLNYQPWFALAEFVDNALQSYLENKARLHAAEGAGWQLRVSIDIDSSPPARIVVRDNACGISLDVFPRAFRPAVLPPDRSGFSEFGMGMKSAACWFAPSWYVRTKALDESVERAVRFDIEKIVRDELEELQIEETSGSLRNHYTEIVLENPHHVPVGRTIGKIKEHLTDIYRVFLRDRSLELRFNGDCLKYEEPGILKAPYYKDPTGESRIWRKSIKFDFGGGLSVTGFAALRDPGNYAHSGFALFRRGRLIEGSGEDGYRPSKIFGTSGSSSYARLRLFGELHLNGFGVSHTKDGFRWDENEEPFVDLLEEHLDSEDLPLLRQCENFRSLAAKKDRTQAATQALKRTGDLIEETIQAILPVVADRPMVETRSAPLEAQPTLASREFRFNFRGQPWVVRIELTDDPAEGDWLSVSDQGETESASETVEIRISMAHPFMVAFAQTDASSIEALLRVAAAFALSEKLARRAGVKSAGTVRRNVNELLREALSQL